MEMRRLVAAAALALWAAAALAGEHHGHEVVKERKDATAAKPQTNCPVMGGKINRGIFADHEGKRVYFCCDGCPAAFKKDPEKYIKKLESDGVTLAKLQTNCPIEGDKIDRKVFADHHGKRVYFCCAGCPARFREDPAKYIKMLESKGIALEAPPHTKPLHKAKDHPH